MTSELSTLDKNVLYLLFPYPDGVEVNLNDWKPEMVTAFRDLVARGYCVEQSAATGLSLVQLTDKGMEAVKP